VQQGLDPVQLRRLPPQHLDRQPARFEVCYALV